MGCPSDENQLIARICRGERETFRELVEAHQGRVYRVCCHVLGDPTRAEDLAQDTFVRAFQKLDQFDSEKGSFAGWILTMARRLCLNALQKASPIPMDDLPELRALASKEPDHSATRTETFARLDQALATLPNDQRRAFVFAEIEELPHEDIAALEDVAIGTVKSRVSRAKQTLRQQLETTYAELKDIQA